MSLSYLSLLICWLSVECSDRWCWMMRSLILTDVIVDLEWSDRWGEMIIVDVRGRSGVWAEDSRSDCRRTNNTVQSSARWQPPTRAIHRWVAFCVLSQFTGEWLLVSCHNSQVSGFLCLVTIHRGVASCVLLQFSSLLGGNYHKGNSHMSGYLCLVTGQFPSRW